MGCISLLIGVSGLLYQWILQQKRRERRIDEILLFLQRTISAMEGERVRIIDYLEQYNSREEVLKDTLLVIAYRLRQNRYPDGIDVWELTICEKQEEWDLDADSFEIVRGIGIGLFGRRRDENVRILQRSQTRLEENWSKMKEKSARERKLWVPVGMLGTVMLMIILIMR